MVWLKENILPNRSEPPCLHGHRPPVYDSASTRPGRPSRSTGPLPVEATISEMVSVGSSEQRRMEACSNHLGSSEMGKSLLCEGTSAKEKETC